MPYITQEDVEARMGSLTEDQAAYLEMLLPAIDEYINGVTGTTFDASADAEVFVDGTCGKTLIIPTMSTVTSVYSVDEDGTETLVDSGSYTRFPRTGAVLALRNRNGTWDEGIENYKIVGTEGFAEVPADIRAIAVEMATNTLNVNLNNYKSERVGDWSVSYGEASSSPVSEASLLTLGRYNRLSRSV